MQPVAIRYNEDYDEGVCEFAWGAALFGRDPGEPNRELAQAAAALAAAAGDANGETGRAEYLCDAYRALGFPDDEIELHSYPRNGRNAADALSANDALAFSIAHRTMGSSRNGGSEFDLVVVALRGTEDPFMEGVLVDFLGTMGEVRWHRFDAYAGIALFADEALSSLDRYCEEHADRFRTGRTVFLVTGHSLGGAAANLLAGALTDRGENVYGYTFGALNSVTDRRSGEYGNIWNIYHRSDTFGPFGEGFRGFKPADCGLTLCNKLGHVLVDATDYDAVFTRGDKAYRNHVMAGYLQSVSRHWDTLAEIADMRPIAGPSG